MSLSSPPRRSRDRREPEWDDHDGRYEHDDNYWARTGSRIYGSMSAPFRLGDGSHRLRALLL
ncbi:MAG: hypothetical protein WA988_13305, partial [Candidatus Nanopelagicales bacterium]